MVEDMAMQSPLQGHDICVTFSYDDEPVPTLCKIRRTSRCVEAVNIETNTGSNFRLSAGEFVTLLFDRKVTIGCFQITLIND